MSKADRKKKRVKFAKPSAPGPWRRPVGDNDNHTNDNLGPVKIGNVWLTAGQTGRYHAAVQDMTSRDMTKRRAAERTIQLLEQEVRASVEAKSVERGLKERHHLEAMRGIAIGKSDIEGAVGADIVVKDGLAHLFARNAITKPQHDAGLRFRTDYEKLNPERGLTPMLLDPAKENVTHGGDNWDDKRAEAIDRLQCIYRMICGVDSKPSDKGMLPLLPRDHPAMRSISALNLIAGQGYMISELVSGSRARARMKGDLTFALDACGIVHEVG